MSAKEKDLVARLLKQSILTVCRETVSYKHRLEVDGIVCISLENDAQQIVIKVHERFQKSCRVGGSLDGNRTSQDDCRIDTHVAQASGVSGTQRPWQDGDRSHCEEDILDCDYGGEDDILTSSDDMEFENNSESRIELKETSVSKMESEDFDDAIPDIQDVDSTTSVPVYKPIITNLMKQKQRRGQKPQTTSRTLCSTPVDTVHHQRSRSDVVSSGSRLQSDSSERIACKRCSLTLPDVASFENHSLLAHSAFTCHICFSTFTSRNNLKRHIRLHTGYKPYQCPRCPECFTRKDDIKRHILRHSYTKPYRCSICNKGYEDRTCIRNHMRKEHNSQILYVCSQCGEGFIDMQKFQTHKKGHPEIRNYQCSLCTFSGTNALMYHKHMLTHGQQKTYTCTPCDAVFNNPFTYSSHVKKHRLDNTYKTYICCFCCTTLTTFDQFVRHENTHVQSKMHSCHICSKHFRYPSTLKEHLMTHALQEESATSTQYWCTECQQGFSSEDLLQEHIYHMHEGKHPGQVCSGDISDEDIDEEGKHQEAPQKVEMVSGGRSNDIDEAGHGDMLSTLLEGLHQRDPGGKAKPLSQLASVLNHSDELEEAVQNDKYPFNKELEEDDPENSSHVDEHSGASQPEIKLAIPQIRITMNGEYVDIKQESVSDDEENGSSSANSFEQSMVEQMLDYSPSPVGSTGNSENLADTPTGSGSSSNISLKVRPPGFDRVVTPYVLFHTKVPLECDICSETFDKFDCFDTHSSTVHRRFFCEYCGKVFTAKPNRERHVRYHTGERPYKCELCGQSFFRGDDLKYHRTTRHSNVKPFVCNSCGLSFAWPKDLEKHIKKHAH